MKTEEKRGMQKEMKEGYRSKIATRDIKSNKGGKSIRILLLTLLNFLFLAIFFSGFINAQQTALYCAEKTTWGASCQMVPLDECQTGTNPATGQPYKCDRTSCESTSYCSEGTCVNTLTGNCLPATRATCDPTQGGFFYDKPKDEVAQCQVGCCILGESATFVERVRCDAMSKDYNLNTTFMPNIQDEFVCSAMAGLQEKGACVFETGRGRECTHATRGECTQQNGEFHEGFLCSAPELGTICTRTTRTTCIEGKNEVYYVDSCGNAANIYDYNKKDNIAYWSYLPGNQGVNVSAGDGAGNINSKTNGFCSYLAGSTCGEAKTTRPALGEYICNDLRCDASPLTGGKVRQHGESWCMAGTGKLANINYFENAKPGDVSYLLYCYNGEIQKEFCDSTRNFLCLENQTAKDASCVMNKWQDCFNPEVDTEEECLDTSLRDCKIITGASLLKTSYGTPRWLNGKYGYSCVPKYPPGLKFWDPKDTIQYNEEEQISIQSMCGIGSVVCYVHYTNDFTVLFDYEIEPSQSCIDQCKREGILGEDKCEEACTPVCLQNGFGNDDDDVEVQRDWAASYQNLCTSIGDCGVSANYQDKDGRNSWKDLFIGNKLIFSKIPNLLSRR